MYNVYPDLVILNMLFYLLWKFIQSFSLPLSLSPFSPSPRLSASLPPSPPDMKHDWWNVTSLFIPVYFLWTWVPTCRSSSLLHFSQKLLPPCFFSVTFLRRPFWATLSKVTPPHLYSVVLASELHRGPYSFSLCVCFWSAPREHGPPCREGTSVPTVVSTGPRVMLVHSRCSSICGV